MTLFDWIGVEIGIEVEAIFVLSHSGTRGCFSGGSSLTLVSSHISAMTSLSARLLY
jgi:hypothetical protein